MEARKRCGWRRRRRVNCQMVVCGGGSRKKAVDKKFVVRSACGLGLGLAARRVNQVNKLRLPDWLGLLPHPRRLLNGQVEPCATCCRSGAGASQATRGNSFRFEE